MSSYRPDNTKFLPVHNNYIANDYSLKVNQSRYRPEVPRGFQEVKIPRLGDKGPGWWYGCKPHAPAAFTPQEILLVLISVRG